MTKRKLIILTKKWGTNFTGATLATQRLVERWYTYFELIIVFTLECGDYRTYSSVEIIQCKSRKNLICKLRKTWLEESNKQGIVGYSDDHLGYMFANIGIPYFHTYHGNWPDAKRINVSFFLKSFYFMPLYKKTIRKAVAVINVSEYMYHFTKKLNMRSVIIRNGIDCNNNIKDLYFPKTFVMVGNVDKRKYLYAIRLLEEINRITEDIHIHIYGKIIDKRIGKKLAQYNNVHTVGHKEVIPYKAYAGMICTSIIENLSLSVCEAIYSGIPVFCFDVGGLSEVVVNGKTGYLIHNLDINEMAEKIVNYIEKKELIEIDKDLLKEFEWDYSSNQYLKIFSEYYYDKGKNLSL